jgi:hypothetical protein
MLKAGQSPRHRGQIHWDTVNVNDVFYSEPTATVMPYHSVHAWPETLNGTRVCVCVVCNAVG